MIRYIIRRILYMIPIIFGVILITFLLFNVAGGSIALSKLGKQATSKSLEEYEVQRGYDKPLFWGLWGATRAYTESDFGTGPGVWSRTDGVTYTNKPSGRILLPAGADYEIPLAFDLYANKKYRWIVKYRFQDQGAGSFVVSEKGKPLKNVDLKSTQSWRRLKVAFETEEDTTALKSRFVVKNGILEIGYIKIEKRVRHFFDSQLCFFLGQIFTLDFGTSVETNQKISSMLKQGALPSLALTVPMFVCSLVMAISLSLVCAFFRNTFIDRFFVVFSVVLMSVNYLVWIIAGQHIIGYNLKWFPIWGFESWRYLVLPCFIGVMSGLGSNLRFYRTVMLDEMYRDYVRTAFAKGVSKTGVLFRHVLMNAMVPILTSVVIALPFLVTGSLLLETFFGIPGLGTISINAINSSDFDVIRAVVFIYAMIYVIANLLTDICYAVVDPRVRLK
ncbi:ABC transporter permease [Verrucomicrobiota bacterium]